MTSESPEIAVFGKGGFGREVAWLIRSTAASTGARLMAFIDDSAQDGQLLAGLPLLDWPTTRRRFPGAAVSVAIGRPATRERVVERCRVDGAAFATLVHHGIFLDPSIRVGEGSIICSGSILTVDIEVGAHVHINLGCTIGHDVRLADFATLSPGVHISGNVHIGRSAFVGTGAVVINGTPEEPLVIGEGSVIAAGACVTRSVEPGTLYAGVPAVLKKRLTT